ncbi:MAG TPA: universal stress protein [Chitinophagales bacterium]|nr:universal stress protein [Chitinophagales bacterium]
MKTILVPTDFSECANNALRVAAFVARKTGANINLLHVHEVPLTGYQGSIEGTVDDIPYMMGLLKATKAKIKKTLSLPFMKGIKVVHNIETGQICDHIIKAAEKYKVDLIIMGTHGVSGLKEAIIGSNAEKIVRNSSVPVITIKDNIIEPKVETIVYATDFSEEFELVFPEVEKIAKLLGAKLEIVKVVTRLQFETTKKSERIISKLKKKFKNSDFSASVYYDFNKQQGIRRFARSKKADMIALGTHGRHGLSHFFNGSIAEELVNHSSVPVLTINLNQNLFHKTEEYADKDGIVHNEREKHPSFDEDFYKHQIPAI